MRTALLLLFLWCASAAGIAQDLGGSRNMDRAFLVRLGYGPFASAGDLGDRFGSGFALGGGVDFLPANSSWQFGIMAQYGFGNDVREDVLAGLRTSAGFLIGNQRQPAEVELRQRQLFLGPRVGYTLRIGGNPRAGLQLATGVGYFYSRIRFQQDAAQFVPQIDKAYQPGYDRLAGGPAVYQFIGYQQLALDRRLNFFLGAEVMAGFTRNLRHFDLATLAPPEDGGRTDVVLGLRVGLIVPLYLGVGREIYY